LFELISEFLQAGKHSVMSSRCHVGKPASLAARQQASKLAGQVAVTLCRLLDDMLSGQQAGTTCGQPAVWTDDKRVNRPAWFFQIVPHRSRRLGGVSGFVPQKPRHGSKRPVRRAVPMAGDSTMSLGTGVCFRPQSPA
jgi:hypothetical protein